LQGVRSSNITSSISTASGLAQEKMEETLSLAYSAVTSSSGSFSAPYSDYSYSVNVTNVNSDFGTGSPDPDIKKVEITVSHGSGVSLNLTTIVTDHN
ncbi:MAG: hypothetical protein GY868_20655, partial [Deltaproteobacteria bacterium]|nr:hypothetical protein [Deltaproteobacteria bacterium]